MFVLYNKTVGNILTARSALDLNATELRIKADILNNCNRLMTAAMLKIVSKLARETAEERLCRSPLDNAEASE